MKWRGKVFLTVFLTAFCVVLSSNLSRSFQNDQEAPLENLDHLIVQSDIIVRGSVNAIDQTLDRTFVNITVSRVYKGDESVQSLMIEHGGGKHIVDWTQPSFNSFDSAILFLEKKRGSDHYVCVNGATGKKTIRNRNVYLHPDNSFLSMKLKKYEKSLSKRIKSLDSSNKTPQASD